MRWVLFVLLVILLLLLIISITKLKVLIDIKHSEDDDHIKIKLSAWFGLIKYTINIPMIKVDEDSPSIVVKQKKMTPTKKENKETTKITPKKFNDYIKDSMLIVNKVFGLHQIVKDLLKKITITRFEWHSEIGIGDAAHTGILAGVGWTVKGTIVGVLSHFMRMSTQPEYTITPSFQQAKSKTKLVCMLHFRIGHAMIAGLKIILKWRDGVPKFHSSTLSKVQGGKTKKSV